MLVAGKRIIVTGGLTGVGRASAVKLAREGAKVVTISRQAPDCEAARKVGETSGVVAHIRCDVSNQAEVNRAFDEAVEMLGGLDGMVGAAGIGKDKPTEELTADDFLEMYSINVLGTHFTDLAAFRHMKGQRSGSIVNFSSVSGLLGRPNQAHYCASRGAVLAYTRAVAREWGPFGIRVNSIAPAAKSEAYYEWEKVLPEDERRRELARRKEQFPLRGDMGTPDDSANVALWLVSDLSSYVTGQVVPVDGGLVMTR